MQKPVLSCELFTKVKVRTKSPPLETKSHICNTFHADSNESASFRPPRLSSFGAQNYSETVGSGSGLSFAYASSPPRIYASQPVHTQEDELSPPVFSAPPASIPLVASQLDQIASQMESFAVPPTTDDVRRETQMATLGTYTNEQETSFHFGFSQVPGILQSVSREPVDDTVEDNSNSSEQFALHYSQLVDTDAMTQV